MRLHQTEADVVTVVKYRLNSARLADCVGVTSAYLYSDAEKLFLAHYPPHAVLGRTTETPLGHGRCFVRAAVLARYRDFHDVSSFSAL